jgi:hypothetical protein
MQFLTLAQVLHQPYKKEYKLETHLSAERRTPGPYVKKWYGGSSSVSRHYPVQTAEGVIRIEWGVRPRVSSFVSEMKSYVAEVGPVKTSLDYREAEKLTTGQQEEILLELLATGNRIGALRAAKHLYGFDTTRAVQFLEELSPTGSKGSSSPRA